MTHFYFSGNINNGKRLHMPHVLNMLSAKFKLLQNASKYTSKYDSVP